MVPPSSSPSPPLTALSGLLTICAKDDSDDDENDLKTAAKYAAVNTDNDADDKTFFKGILGHIDEKKDKLEEEDIDEEG